jgi:hypothetical protein
MSEGVSRSGGGGGLQGEEARYSVFTNACEILNEAAEVVCVCLVGHMCLTFWCVRAKKLWSVYAMRALY